MANLALFLISDESSFCNGEVYLADGGFTAGQKNLAIQIVDSNKFLRSQTPYNALQLNTNALTEVISDRELAKLLVRWDRGIDDGTEGQAKQCLQYYFVLFSTWEYIYYQNIDTSLPETFWEGAVADYGNELRSIGYFRVFQKITKKRLKNS